MERNRRSVIITSVILALLATPAISQGREQPGFISENHWRNGAGGSSVELQPTKEPGAVAQLEFKNTTGDAGGRSFHEFQLGDIGIILELGTANPDNIQVITPEGYFADQETAETPDGETIIIFIYPETFLGV